MAGEATKTVWEIRAKQMKPVLYVDKNQPESLDALELLKDFDFDIVDLTGRAKDEESMTTPCLFAGTSFHRGIRMIQYFVKYTRELAEEEAEDR